MSLLKKEPESRWRKLLAEGQVKPSNMNTWWEMSEKHEKELDDLAPLDDDDEAKNDGFVDVNKKVKSKKDKRSKVCERSNFNHFIGKKEKHSGDESDGSDGEVVSDGLPHDQGAAKEEL